MATATKPLTKATSQSAAGAKKKISKKLRSAPQSMSASKAKTHLLELLDTVDRDRTPITITKRGRPVATLIPIADKPKTSIFGYMKGSGIITGDVVGPEPDIWNAMVE
jgi:prevent-host-death family protein